MNTQKFAIIDIETTGGIARRDKITEIGVIIIQNNEIVDQFETLLNPERSIPPEITRMTGITNEMVSSAPKFYEVAKTLTLLTTDCIFVAHNVSFDYGFIKEEFAQLGYSYNRKKLCTLQMARRQFKGLSSYSLGNLIKHFNIEVTARHRAMEDCKATVELFLLLLNDERQNKPLGKLIPDLIQANKLPSSLLSEDIKALPEQAGVYYMKDKTKTPIYIGKSKNIRERIIQHFNDLKPKTKKMLDQVHFIDYKICSNDLMACLLESAEIKLHQPEINKALRKKTNAYYLTLKSKQNSYSKITICASEWLSPTDKILVPYTSRAEAREHLNMLIDEYSLCPHINEGKEDLIPCYKYQIQKCKGACCGMENFDEYNSRVNELCDSVYSAFSEDFILLGDGFTEGYQSIVLVENGYCSNYGELANYNIDLTLNDLKKLLEPYPGDVDSNRIIRQALNNPVHYKKVILKK